MKDLLEELERRLQRKAFSPAALCFPPQLAFVASQAKRKAVRCSRRAGKTTGVAVALLDGALTAPHAHQFYVGPTLKNARQVLWPVLKRINAEYTLGGVANEAEVFMRFPALPGEPRIYLGGAKDSAEIERLRGHHGKRFVVDEAQSIRPSLLHQLVDDVVEPALLDYDGELAVIGTPGPVMAGYFHAIDIGEASAAWEHHRWTLRDNPHLERLSGRQIGDLLREIRERHGWTETSPTFVREYLGEWVSDSAALMFAYDEARNACPWATEPRDGWTYVVGFDLGHDDADAIAVLGWPRHERRVQLCLELVRPRQGVTELGDQLRDVFTRFRPIRLVGDCGGLGKKIAEELRRRWQLPVVAADKTRKAEHIELVNDALRTGSLLAPTDSRFAEDAAIMQWDQDAKLRGVLREDPGYHSDVCDAVLYAYRECLHWLEQPAAPALDAAGKMDAFEREEAERIERSKGLGWADRDMEAMGFAERW